MEGAPPRVTLVLGRSRVEYDHGKGGQKGRAIGQPDRVVRIGNVGSVFHDVVTRTN